MVKIYFDKSVWSNYFRKNLCNLK